MTWVAKGYVLAAALSILSGCAALKGHPETSANKQAELAFLSKYYQPEVVEQCSDKSDPAQQKKCRDEIVDGRIRAIDLHFSDFQKELYASGLASNIAVDWAVLTMNATSAVTGSAASKAALSAASGGLIGAKASFDRNAYFEKTMPAILSTMIAQRKTVLARIREHQTLKKLTEYPLQRALIDVEDYYAAGTIPGAIIVVSQDAGDAGQKADKKLQNVFEFKRDTEFLKPDKRVRVSQILDSIDALSDTAVIAMAKNPPLTTPDLEKLINARYPPSKRDPNNPTHARAVLRMRVTMSERSESDLDKWDAAVQRAK